MKRHAIISLVLLSYTGISVGTIGKAMLTPFHLYMGFFIAYGLFVVKKSKPHTFLTLVVLMVYILFVNVLNFPNIRYTSILYTIIYGLEISILYNLMRFCSVEDMLGGFKIIVYSYAANLFLGVAFDTVGFHNAFIGDYIRVHHTEGEAGGRPMGFASEPSYAAFIISVVYLCFSHLRHHRWDGDAIKLTVAYIACILFSKSAYGFIFVAVNGMDWFFHFYSRSGAALRGLLPLIGIVGLFGAVMMMGSSENETITRLAKVSEVLADPSYTAQKKMKKLQEADGSAFARIGPTFMLMNSGGGDADVNFIIGAGAGAAGTFIAKFMEGITVDEGTEKMDTGIIPAFVFDYGIIGMILLVVFFINSFRRLSLPFWIMVLLILPNANINTQLLWFAIGCYLYVSMIKAAESASMR